MRRVYTLVRRLEQLGLAVAMLAMAAVTIANVVVRNATGETLAFAEELNQFLIVFVCFVGLSYAAGEGRHIRMTALFDALPQTARRRGMAALCGSTALLLCVLAYYAARYAWSVDRRSPVLGVPLSIVYALAPVGLAMGGVQYALAAAKNLTSREVWVSFDRRDGPEELDSDVTEADEVS